MPRTAASPPTSCSAVRQPGRHAAAVLRQSVRFDQGKLGSPHHSIMSSCTSNRKKWMPGVTTRCFESHAGGATSCPLAQPRGLQNSRAATAAGACLRDRGVLRLVLGDAPHELGVLPRADQARKLQAPGGQVGGGVGAPHPRRAVCFCCCCCRKTTKQWRHTLRANQARGG